MNSDFETLPELKEILGFFITRFKRTVKYQKDKKDISRHWNHFKRTI